MPREAVFRFFVDPVLLGRWLGGVQALDARPGGDLCFETSFDGVVRGHFLVVSPPDRVAWSWEREGRALAPSRIDIEFAARHEGTLVQLAHRGDPAAAPRDDFWRQALAKLYAAALGIPCPGAVP